MVLNRVFVLALATVSPAVLGRVTDKRGGIFAFVFHPYDSRGMEGMKYN